MGLGDLNVEIALHNLTLAIQRYGTELHLELPRIVRQTARLIMRDLVSITAPDSLAQGRKAVARDISRAVFLLEASKTSKKSLAKAIRNHDNAAVLAILKNSKRGNWRNFRQVVSFSPALHTSVRNRRGKVPKVMGIATTDLSHKKYVRAIQGHVGFSKDGWGPAAAATGLTLPGWISRHVSPPGRVVDRLNVFDNPSITAIHDGAMSGNLPLSKIANVIERRAATMHRDVDQILKGRASRYFS